ncbi:MAG TPA: L-histidine N(alpha)-methyltransferase [Solirubrobacterales bacterium]|nr:L-histidine N(alpha)-methyltransferase [Solirubrobacterales bacterium]
MGDPGKHSPSFADRLSKLTRLLAEEDSPLALGLWERGASVRIGQVTQAIKGGSKKVRRIEDGYQYVGGFPAHMWKLATADTQYKTLSHSISTFPKRWNTLRKEIEARMHYVSIGPGTGEKDGTVLKHLASVASEPIVYIPVDISADLLRMSLEVSMQGIDEEKIDVLPIELDIASDRGLEGLRKVIGLMTDGPVLLSLLGNTLANFQEDAKMLANIAALLSGSDDMLLMEVATTKEASDEIAAKAASEYEGSVSFRNFVMAALTQYTNCTAESGRVVYDGHSSGTAIEITTYFTPKKRLEIYVSDTDHFPLGTKESIELYRSRKYTPEALENLFSGFSELSQKDTPYSDDFGVNTSLLRYGDSKHDWTIHPAARMS